MLPPALPVAAHARRRRRDPARREARRRPRLDVTNVRILYKE